MELINELGFKETHVLSELTQRRLLKIKLSNTSAHKNIGGMLKLIHLGTVPVLIVVNAVLLPSTSFGEDTAVSSCNFCCLVGIHCDSKYVKFVDENRKKRGHFS